MLETRVSIYLSSIYLPISIDPSIQEEHVSITEDGKEALMRLAQGDMRKVINILQSAAMAFKEVTTSIF